MDSYDVLVIILSVMLAVFLAVGIVAGVLAIKILKRAKEASDSVANAVENVQQFTGSVSKLASGPMLLTMLDRVLKKVKRK